MLKSTKRETDGRFALLLNSRKAVKRHEDRAAQREQRRQELYADAIARGLSEEQAVEEMFLFA